MDTLEGLFQSLRRIPELELARDEPLARHTRFAIGGPAAIYAQAASPDAFVEALRLARSGGIPLVVVGGGTNLVASDEGFPGVVLRFTGNRIARRNGTVNAQAGAELNRLVDYTVDNGLQGLETLAGIPGSVGGAVYGNAGAYGHSISECIASVSYFDGGEARVLDHSQCQFSYRESIFKRKKDWLIFEAELKLRPAPAEELRETASRIRKTRNEKFPPEMKCAGSIFKNLNLAELPRAAAASVPPEAVREGKVPAAWFLEQAGAKGMERGGIRVAPYHANLIYNAGAGTARDLRALIRELKERVRARFGFELEEEVQYVGSE